MELSTALPPVHLVLMETRHKQRPRHACAGGRLQSGVLLGGGPPYRWDTQIQKWRLAAVPPLSFCCLFDVF